ncbi:TRAP transporter permease, partial [Chloroflexota bacterium]
MADVIEEKATSLWLTPGRLTSERIRAGILLFAILVVAMFHVFTIAFGTLEPWAQRVVSLSLIMVLAPMLYPLGRKSWWEGFNRFFVVDLIIMIVPIITIGYIIADYYNMAYIRMAGANTFDIVLGTLYMACLLELCRRAIGWIMSAIVLFLLLQSLLSAYLPGMLYGPPVKWKVMVEISFFADQGIFGVAMFVVANYLVMFLIFVGFLLASGASEFFVKLSLGLAGKFRGGPAKVAVVASSMVAMIQGVATTNVASTGSVTIPMMKKAGYKPHFAGAVETVASSGGGITPPVMSLTAFIMAELLGVSYWTVCLAAIVPALLYYITCFATVHFEAIKLDLKGLPPEQIPPVLPTLARGGHLLLPIVVLVFFIALQWGIGYCALIATLVLFAVTWIRKETRWTPARLLGAFERTGRLIVIAGIACGAVGILVGSFYVSGLGPRLSEYIVAASMGQPWIALLIAGAICLLMGMGMPVIPVYMTLFMMAIPALIKMGLPDLPVHFFVLYL